MTKSVPKAEETRCLAGFSREAGQESSRRTHPRAPSLAGAGAGSRGEPWVPLPARLVSVCLGGSGLYSGLALCSGSVLGSHVMLGFEQGSVVCKASPYTPVLFLPSVCGCFPNSYERPECSWHAELPRFSIQISLFLTPSFPSILSLPPFPLTDCIVFHVRHIEIMKNHVLKH